MVPITESRVHIDALDPVQKDRVVGKVFKRLIWFLFILYVFSFLNRINISFAALSMNKALGLTATMYALANASFYLGYILAEVPSNLMLTRLGARVWIPCIMVTWGIASAATMLSMGSHSLVLIRLIVGTAEGGFLPGILLYLTFWFPQSYRARANSVFMTAQPIAIVFGSSVSGLILSINGYLGLAGWRWLFLLEGLPSAVLGIIAFFYLTDNPSRAKWLTADERHPPTRHRSRPCRGSAPHGRQRFSGTYVSKRLAIDAVLVCPGHDPQCQRCLVAADRARRARA